jgi:magnesium transporter
MFISVVSSLHSELDVLNNLVTKLLSDLEDSVQQDKLKDLLQYTKKLSDFYQGVMTIRDAINEVLDQGKHKLYANKQLLALAFYLAFSD